MQEPHPSGTETGTPERPVAVAVKRTGGFAGVTKQWRAEPPAAEASAWIDLIAQCPWDSVASREPAAGADRFTWCIQARCGDQDERQAELPDDEMVGAWRDLVDAVREWNRAAAG